jgi:hypothetical protein
MQIIGLYISTEDCEGYLPYPDDNMDVKKFNVYKDSIMVMTYFDEYGCEFLLELNGKLQELRIDRPCKVVAAACCQYCGLIVPTEKLTIHQIEDQNCFRCQNAKGN